MYDEDPGYCPDCGVQHQLVRPGKSQPNCDCHLKCPDCGLIQEYYSHDKGSGWACMDCRPEEFNNFYNN